MSTIIECPACSTRYKMNKPIPEGGRYVKCARCGNQWRLVPEGHVEDIMELEPGEHNPVTHAQAESAAEEIRQAMAARQPHEPASEDEADAVSSWQATREQFAAAIPSLSDPQATGYGQSPADEPEDDAADQPGWQNFSAEAATEAEPEPEQESWAQRTYARGLAEAAEAAQASQDDAASEGDEERQADAEWSPMTRPWRESAEASRAESEDSEEDAEAAIRHALKFALENPGEEGAQELHVAEQPSQRGDDATSDFGWTPFRSRDTAPDFAGPEASKSDEDDEAPEQQRAAHRPFTIPGHDDMADEDSEVEAPFRLTGRSGRRAIYDAAQEEGTEGYENATDDLSFQSDIEDAFKSGPLPKRPLETGKPRHDEQFTDFDSLYDEQSGQPVGAGHFDPEFYEQEAAALQAQLESTDIAAYQDQRAVGGLALAAGWAVFISVISGVALGLVSFRQEIMTALPGTSSLYRAIGFSVADSGVDFADVSYRWTVTEGKPMIEVKGQGVNVTDRRVTVPRVLINVHDGQNSDTVKATATVQTEWLAPREKADFTLEFVSPPKNISQIELEFDRNQ